MIEVDIGILGGGISGLSLAAFLGRRAEVLEADHTVGGLARTFGQGGFSSDIGGHIMFSKDQEALDVMVGLLGDNVERRRRTNVILYDGALVKYPFENGLASLPSKQDVFECVDGFVRAWAASQSAGAGEPERADDLEAWCYRLFGPGISDKYLIPYNEKIWKRRASDIATHWVDRVPMPPVEDVLKSALGIETEGYTHQLYFFYPREGGIESLPRALVARAQARGQTVHLGFRVSSVRRRRDRWVVSDGTQERSYRTIVSTVPILPFLETLADVPTRVMDAARELAYNSLRVVLLGVSTPGLDKHTAVYVPNPLSIYHRVCFNNAFSPSMAPPGSSSVSAEITCRDGDDTSRLGDDELVKRVVDDLDRDGLVPRDSVRESAVRRERYAYVVYDHGYTERIKTVRDFLSAHDIHVAGRFAEYKYVNMDACIRRTLDLAAQLDRDARNTA